MIADAPRVGRVIAGRYRVEEACAQGSAPFAARAVRVVDGVDVLLFTAPPSVVRDGGVQRFTELARPLRGFAEGLWMMVLDEGVDADGSPFLATSYWSRETVEQRVLRAGAINASVAAEVAVDVLGALGALHARDMAHRGLSPEDVLLVMGEDGALHGHVLAGGLLRALACGARAGESVVRAACAAPEQHRGELGGPEADVWAVGVTLYRMLTASLPFPGTTTEEVVLAAATQDFTPLPSRLPDGFARVIARALSKRAPARYPDARAMRDDLLKALVEAGLREHPGAAPSQRPATVDDPEDDAGDLDALIELAKVPSKRPSMAPPSAAGLSRPPLSLGPPRSLSPQAPSRDPVAASGPAPASFDLDSVQPPPTGAQVEIPRPAPVPNIPVAPSSPAPAFSARESSVAVSKPRPSRTFEPPPKPKGGTISAGSALLVVIAVTAGAGYLSRDFLRRTFSPSPTGLGDLEVPSEPSTRVDGAVDAAVAVQDVAAADAEPETPSGPFQPRVETQSPAEFGEQLRVPLPPGLSSLQRHQFVTHVTSAPPNLAATVGGFASCVDGRVFLHPGGVNGALREGAAGARCEGVDLALTEDLDGDGRGDVIAIDARRGAVLVVGSRRMRVERSLALPDAWAITAGLSFEVGRRREPAAVVYTAGDGVLPTLVAVGLRSGRVFWRADPALHVGAPGDYGLSVAGDLDRDGAPDVVVGLLREGRHCVTVLSGATGVPVWRQPRCTREVGAQYLSAGPDLDDDHRGEIALGSAFGHRLTVLSGADGAEMVSAPPATEAATLSLGQGMLMTPDLARDGFPDLVAPTSEGNASVVVVYSANDGHRQGAIPVSYDGAPVSISQIRIQYLENFVFDGSRSLLVATPGGLQIFGASPRS